MAPRPNDRGPIVPQEQEQKKTQKRSGGGGDDDAGQVSSATKGEKLKEEMDDILDEIDSVLEENAEEFVKSYVQKGGE
jgi:prokaryotic ubiquitin-like protein Pup